MKMLSFLPLLIWALGLLYLHYVSIKWEATKFDWTKEEYKKHTDEQGAAFAKLWWIGVVFFLIFGLLTLPT